MVRSTYIQYYSIFMYILYIYVYFVGAKAFEILYKCLPNMYIHRYMYVSNVYKKQMNRKKQKQKQYANLYSRLKLLMLQKQNLI